ncbi:MAG: hypothetical protein IJD98_01980 [Oscillospiraceae bacterium]|nr:hypothetical protein [Oscillospiraceae bacterium]
MRSVKKFLITLLILLLIVVAAMVWVLMNFHLVNFRLFPKNVAELNLRGQEISVSTYEKLAEKMPGTRIRWDVPFQDGTVPEDTEEVTVETLSDKDVQALVLLKNLKTVNAQSCLDYPQLYTLQMLRPDVNVDYSIHFSGDSYRWDVEQLVLDQVREEDIQLLQLLPNLETVALSGGSFDPHTADALQGMTHNLGLNFGIVVDGSLYLDTETDVELENITDGELSLLSRLHGLRKLHLVNPMAEPQTVFELEDSLPGVEISWEVEVAGETFDREATEVDLSEVEVEDLEELEQRLAYLPDLEQVTLGLCGIDNPDWGKSKTKNLAVCEIENEDLAAYRDRVREDYKVVWTVRLGPDIALRTDKDNFMPNHFGVGRLFDDYAYNLRYCEDMVCLDVGHMTLTDISFVEYMPKLKYLILAWTEVQYIEPIRSCKNLVFLELDNSCIRDYSPVVDCTALEDLNIGNTFCDITPILEMTWLKNLYMILGDGGKAWQASQALPDTHVVASGDATVGGGWRRLPNYYDMRDCLGMYYMN